MLDASIWGHVMSRRSRLSSIGILHFMQVGAVTFELHVTAPTQSDGTGLNWKHVETIHSDRIRIQLGRVSSPGACFQDNFTAPPRIITQPIISHHPQNAVSAYMNSRIKLEKHVSLLLSALYFLLHFFLLEPKRQNTLTAHHECWSTQVKQIVEQSAPQAAICFIQLITSCWTSRMLHAMCYQRCRKYKRNQLVRWRYK
jgi:hypothetical protein